MISNIARYELGTNDIQHGIVCITAPWLEEGVRDVPLQKFVASHMPLLIYSSELLKKFLRRDFITQSLSHLQIIFSSTENS